MSNLSNDEVVSTSNIYKTTNYRKFKTLAGNRLEDTAHTRRLAKKIEKEGNLTDVFPIQVNEKDEIIDGLHRLRALESLKLPVYYEVKPNLNVNSVITKNTGGKNWSWRDFATSWAERGNKNYAQLLELADMFPHIQYTVLTYYSNGTEKARSNEVFKGGDFTVTDFDATRKLLMQYDELADASGYHRRELAHAAYKFMRTPSYEHKRMIQKIAAYGERFSRCYTVFDYLSALDDIYRL